MVSCCDVPDMDPQVSGTISSGSPIPGSPRLLRLSRGNSEELSKSVAISDQLQEPLANNRERPMHNCKDMPFAFCGQCW